MKKIEAIFIAFGDSPEVLALADGQLGGELGLDIATQAIRERKSD